MKPVAPANASNQGTLSKDQQGFYTGAAAESLSHSSCVIDTAQATKKQSSI